VGNQQLFLIIVGIIVVIIAVFFSFDIFSKSYVEQIKDLAIHKTHDIGMMANIYRKKTTAQGGGGGSYIGFNNLLNDKLKKDDVVENFTLNAKKNKITMRFTLHAKGDNQKSYKIWASYNEDGLERLRVYEPDQKDWVWLYNE